jgi:hypothetical protein
MSSLPENRATPIWLGNRSTTYRCERPHTERFHAIAMSSPNGHCRLLLLFPVLARVQGIRKIRQADETLFDSAYTTSGRIRDSSTQADLSLSTFFMWSFTTPRRRSLQAGLPPKKIDGARRDSSIIVQEHPAAASVKIEHRKWCRTRRV